MKKWSYGLCLMLILAVCASVGFASAQTERVGPRRLAVVNHADPDTLACIWARPQEDATPLFRYYNGVELVVFEEFENGWASVAIGPIEGYMKTESLTIGAEAEQGRNLPIFQVVNPPGTTWTNFRDKPKMESTVIDQYPTGKEVTLLGVSDEWYQVFTNSTMGFIKREFLEDTGKTGGYIMGGPASYPTKRPASSAPAMRQASPAKQPAGAPLSATIITLPANDEFGVYLGPGSTYRRPAQGAETVKTDNPVWCYGIVDGYALIRYAAADGRYHMGYIEEKWLVNPSETVELQLVRTEALVNKPADVMDDPFASAAPLIRLRAGDVVYYLAMLDEEWAHIEVIAPDGLPTRGFIRRGDLDM